MRPRGLAGPGEAGLRGRHLGSGPESLRQASGWATGLRAAGGSPTPSSSSHPEQFVLQMNPHQSLPRAHCSCWVPGSHLQKSPSSEYEEPLRASVGSHLARGLAHRARSRVAGPKRSFSPSWPTMCGEYRLSDTWRNQSGGGSSEFLSKRVRRNQSPKDQNQPLPVQTHLSSHKACRGPSCSLHVSPALGPVLGLLPRLQAALATPDTATKALPAPAQPVLAFPVCSVTCP
ncbi:uncharacterized protein LOC116658738 [Camelus ferus]|uniref:Uncharacterized protein LOC116658738 n=1 Tax=Camelus ferus TaxID=419612 RepID=A0A8B8RQC2_CAMFR|nr:uncharacterized protein LOC116658738 [Camelus ferus]XP_032320144.1 uncharacterized protein LOC116658738 [Camelus ferus]